MLAGAIRPQVESERRTSVTSLIDLWKSGVAAVRGEPAVRAALPGLRRPPDQILAIGKAACDMARPALDAFPDCPALIVTKHGHTDAMPGTPKVIEAGHPIPDVASLEGGAALLSKVQACSATDHVLVLVSGGASAVAELLPDGMTLDAWQAETQGLMASGADIHEINTRRREISRIKGGKLLAAFGGQLATTLAISDVEGDDLNVIGSGIGAGSGDSFQAEIIASNAIARKAITDAASEPIIVNEECLYDDVYALAPRLARRMKDGPAGLYIMGGEPTVQLPDEPGRGGRNQALALLLAREIAGIEGLEILVAGTDGTDGPTEDAGAIVNGATWHETAADYLSRADAGSFLATRDALVRTGPTGTNVMDVLIARKT